MLTHFQVGVSRKSEGLVPKHVGYVTVNESSSYLQMWQDAEAKATVQFGQDVELRHADCKPENWD